MQEAQKQLTLAIIKPNLVEQNQTNSILFDLFQESAHKGSDISLEYLVSLKMTKEEVQQFYAEHLDKPFFSELVEFMTSGESIFMILGGKNVVSDWRTLIGATKPQDRTPNCLRAKYGDPNITMLNGLHGSDSATSAQREITLLGQFITNRQKQH